MKIDQDELLLYVMNQLSPDRAAAVAAAVLTDPALQAEMQAQQEALGLLLGDLDLDAVHIPADAKSRLLSRAQAETVPISEPATSSALNPAPARRSWWLALPLSLAAALALFFALRSPADPVRQYTRQPGAVTRTITASGQDFGKLVQLADGRVFIHLHQAAQPGYTYQLWQIKDEKPVSLGIFSQSGLLTPPLAAGATLAVSVEPAGGSPQPTTKPLFAQSL